MNPESGSVQKGLEIEKLNETRLDKKYRLSTTQSQRRTGKQLITPSEFSEKIVMNQIFGEGLNALITPGEKFRVLDGCVTRDKARKECPEELA